MAVILAVEGGEAALEAEAVGYEGLTVGLEEVLKRSHLHTGGVGGDTEIGTEIDTGLAGLTLTGRYKDDAVCSTGAIDGRCRSILKDFNVGNILRVEPAEVGMRAVLDTVHYPKRIGVAVHRGDAANTDARSAGRVTAGLGDDDTGSGSLKALDDGHRGTAKHRFGVHGCHGAGDVALLLGTIADCYGLLKELRVFVEDEVDSTLTPSEGDFLVGITDAGGDEGGVGRNVRNGEGTIDVGLCTDGRRALDEHAGGNDRFAVCILNRTCYSVLGKYGNARAQSEQDGHKRRFKMILHHKTDC